MNAPHTPHALRLAALRAELRRHGLAGFVVPRTDEHQGEYVPPSAQRLSWLTGFQGSAGMAVVFADEAAVFVDGRYTVQVRQQVDGTLFAYKHLIEEPPESWVKSKLKAGERFALDPWLHSADTAQRFRRACEEAGATLELVSNNPLDVVWEDQPVPPCGAVKPQPLEFAGAGSLDKRAKLAADLSKRGIAAAVLTLPDSICWLLNVRGSDVERNPFALSFALLQADGGVKWFLAEGKMTAAVKATLDAAVLVLSPDEFGPALDKLRGKRVLVETSSAPAWVVERLKHASAEVVEGEDPCQLPKATKNATEANGSRAAHRRDGVSLTKFLAWFDREAPSGTISEIDMADRLEAFRREDNLFQDLSFETIAGSGPNGALPHYKATPEAHRTVKSGDMIVLDSGGQFLDGTTDVTRTLMVGEPTAEMRDCHTRVLQGHIALATARFPKGTTGSQLDVLARLPLWRAGLDYDHGTGHGVGSYLSVHEGPQRIGKAPNRVALLPGMIISNEPGYYKDGAFGMRVENLVLVVESPKVAGEEREMLAFETLTLAPIDRRLINKKLMTEDEIAWVDAYHARVMAEIGPSLEAKDRAWLSEACASL